MLKQREIINRISKVAWAAGIIDGEGYIGLVKCNPTIKNRQHNIRYCATINVTMTDKKKLLELKKIFSVGNIYTKSLKNKKHKDQYSWMVSSNKAAEVLAQTIDYMITKKKQAALIIKFTTLPKRREGQKTAKT